MIVDRSKACLFAKKTKELPKRSFQIEANSCSTEFFHPSAKMTRNQPIYGKMSLFMRWEIIRCKLAALTGQAILEPIGSIW